jgi:hypothetical protein
MYRLVELRKDGVPAVIAIGLPEETAAHIRAMLATQQRTT